MQAPISHLLVVYTVHNRFSYLTAISKQELEIRFCWMLNTTMVCNVKKKNVRREYAENRNTKKLSCNNCWKMWKQMLMIGRGSISCTNCKEINLEMLDDNVAVKDGTASKQHEWTYTVNGFSWQTRI